MKVLVQAPSKHVIKKGSAKAFLLGDSGGNGATWLQVKAASYSDREHGTARVQRGYVPPEWKAGGGLVLLMAIVCNVVC